MKGHETESKDDLSSTLPLDPRPSSLDIPHSILERFVREPLLHFLLLGVLIFAAFKFISTDTSQPGKILITQGRIESLATTFSRTWRRPPSASELEGLIRDYIREEVFAREAVALGLDKDDTIIRRRLRQKLEFISEDVAAHAEPTDEQLRAYLKEHPDTFRGDRRYTFSQVYLDPQRRGANLSRDAAQVLTQLGRPGSKVDPATLGDSLMLENEFKALPASEVMKQFGEKFAASLGEMPTGQWHGPIESGFGVHLVLLKRAHRGLPAGAGRRARRGAPRVDQRAPDGSEREVLPNFAKALRSDHRAAGGGQRY